MSMSQQGKLLLSCLAVIFSFYLVYLVAVPPKNWPKEIILPDTPQEIAPLLTGKWINDNPNSDDISRIEIDPDGYIRWWSPWIPGEVEHLHEPGRLATCATFNQTKGWSDDVRVGMLIDNLRVGTLVFRRFQVTNSDKLTVQTTIIDVERRNSTIPIETYSRVSEFPVTKVKVEKFPGYNTTAKSQFYELLQCSFAKDDDGGPRSRSCGPIGSPTRLECIEASHECSGEPPGRRNCLPQRQGGCLCKRGTVQEPEETVFITSNDEPTLAIK